MSNDDQKQAPTTTTDAGIPVASDEFSLTVGAEGPTTGELRVAEPVQPFGSLRESA
jgi:catalase